MSSRTIIMIICSVVSVLYWTELAFPDGLLPLALIGSFLLMDLFGMFKRELITASAKQDNKEEPLAPDDTNDRSVTMQLYDGTGAAASITIHSTGQITTTGTPNQTILAIAKDLPAHVIDAGPEEIISEMTRRLAEEEDE